VRGFFRVAAPSSSKKYNIGVSCCARVCKHQHSRVRAVPPEKYGENGVLRCRSGGVQAAEGGYRGRIDPLDLARLLLAAVRRGDFWILPYPEFIPTLEAYNEQVIGALKQYEDDPDYQRRKRLGRGMPERAHDDQYYHAEPVANSLKSMIPLLEKGLPLRECVCRFAQVRAALGLVRSDQREGQVPVLDHDGIVITHTTVINEYLEDAFPDTPLRPRTRWVRRACATGTSLSTNT